MNNLKLVVIFIIIFVSQLNFTVYADKLGDPNTNSKLILKKVNNTYNSLKTYHDKGKLFSEHVKIDFETDYDQNDGNSLFDLSLKEYDYITNRHTKIRINKSKNGVIVYSDRFKKVKKIKVNSLEEAVNKILPNDQGLFINVPNQIYKDLGFKPLTDLENVKVLNDVLIDKKPCFHLSGEFNTKNGTKILYHLYILKQSYLFKLIKRITKYGKITYVYQEIKREGSNL